MTGTPSKAKREAPSARRARIIEEAIRVIGRGGYHAFTVQEMALRSGLTCAGLLYHFGSKGGLLLAVLKEFETREAKLMAPLVRAAEQDPGSPQAKAALLQFLRTMAVRMREQPHVGRLIMMLQTESIDPSHPAHLWWQARESAVLELFMRLIAPYTSAPRETALLMFAMLDGLGEHWMRQEQAFDLVAMWDAALAALLPEVTRPAPG